MHGLGARFAVTVCEHVNTKDETPAEPGLCCSGNCRSCAPLWTGTRLEGTMTSPEDSARARPMLCCGTVLSSRLFGKRPTLTRFRHLTQHFSGRQQQAPVSNRTRASGRNMSQDTSGEAQQRVKVLRKLLSTSWTHDCVDCLTRRNLLAQFSDHVEPPPWFLELERQPGVTDSHKALYWEASSSIKGSV